MESIHEIVPFAKEMLSQKPGRGMVKVYVLGSVLAFLGLAMGLVETVCQSFSPSDPLDEELVQPTAGERRLQKQEEIGAGRDTSVAMATGPASKQRVTAAPRNPANRLHAS